MSKKGGLHIAIYDQNMISKIKNNCPDGFYTDFAMKVFKLYFDDPIHMSKEELIEEVRRLRK